MRRVGIIVAAIMLSGFAGGENGKDPAHRACSWCHTPSTASSQVVPANAPKTRRASTTCLGCHDGVTADSLNEGHLNHRVTSSHTGLDCVVCHDPHDRTGSYRLLRGKRGPETPMSAVLGFCRGCHPNH